MKCEIRIEGSRMMKICEMRNGNEACLTTTSIKSGHISKVKVVLALDMGFHRYNGSIFDYFETLFE